MSTYIFQYQLFVYSVHIFYNLLCVTENVVTCVIYSTTVYHNSECDIPNFECIDSCCYFGRGVLTCFPVFGGI